MVEQYETWGPSPDPEPPRRTSWLPACLIGCLAISVICVVICGGLFYYVAKNAGKFARTATVRAVEASELSDEDKQAVIAQVDRVVEAYEAGEIGLGQVKTIFEELRKSPLFGLVIVEAADAKYISPSGLTDEEKDAGRRTLQRVARGVADGLIDHDDLNPALDYISVERSQHRREFKNKVSDDELREFLAECKRQADLAEIPDEPYDVDIGAEFKRAVDKALGANDDSLRTKD